MPPKRGPYKRYLDDDDAPIPRRSRTYYDAEAQEFDENNQNVNICGENGDCGNQRAEGELHEVARNIEEMQDELGGDVGPFIQGVERENNFQLNNPRVLRTEAAAQHLLQETNNPELAHNIAVVCDNNQNAEDEDIGIEEYTHDNDAEDEVIHQEIQPNLNQAEQEIQEEQVIEEELLAPAAGPESHAELRKSIQTETFTSPITAQVTVSPAEVLLMALNMAEQNKLTFKAFVDSVKLLNTLFVAPVMPNTVYMLDKLLNASAGIQRYFYCYSCSHSFGKRDSTAEPTLECPACGFVNKIKDLTQAAYLVVFPLQAQIELLLKSKKVREALKCPKQVIKDRNPDELTDLYDGKCYKDFANSLTEEEANLIISMIGNTDGTPLFKSSTYSIWPFFNSINELPPEIRMKNLCLSGLWFSNKKPPMDLYLEPIVEHLLELSRGFTIRPGNHADEELLVKAFMIGLCVDSGARGPVQGLNTHSGYYSCNWCEISGEWNEKVCFPFPEIPPQKRTHERIVQHARECLHNEALAYVYGVQYLSPLAMLPKFDLVNGMVLDYAHNVLFGLARSMLEEWLSNTNKGYYIGAPDDLLLLDNKIMKLKPPIEVRKPIRKVSDRAHWSMREFENWTFFYSIPVLNGILPGKYLDHWTLLVQGMFLLSRQKITRQDIATAHELFLHYGRDAEFLYGKSFATYNLHIFCQHMGENAVRWGPLWAINTFCYESGNKDLKNLLHAQHGVPHQIQRALSYRQASSILEINCGSQKTNAFKASVVGKVSKMTRCTPVPECALMGVSKRLTLSDEEKFLIDQCGIGLDVSNCLEFNKIIAKKCVYVTCKLASGKKFDNGYAITDDNKIIVIKKFILDQFSEKVFIFCNEASAEPFLRMPQGVRILPADNCMRVITLFAGRLHLISVQRLKSICTVSHLNNRIYVSEFSNVYNVC